MARRLSGWKAKTLSLAGRLTLVKSVTSAIPNHLMQTMELPRSVCDHIDKVNRSFLWGSSETRRRVHLVNWQHVCQSKKQGGLGIRKARDQNAALISKLGWKITSNSSELWCQVLQTKYLMHHSLSSWPNTRRASHTWNSIIRNRTFLEENIKWTVGAGENISLWTNWWCASKPLCYTNLGPHIDISTKVSSIIDDEGNWDLTPIQDLINQQAKDAILSIHRPRFVTYFDLLTGMVLLVVSILLQLPTKL